jgi:hypothetical protein
VLLEGFPEVFAESHSFVLKNFAVASFSSAFLEMTEDDLIALFSDDNLQVSSEDLAFKALLRWANADNVARKMAFVRLASHVRFSLCSHELLSTDFFNEPLMNNDGCLALIKEAQASHFDKSKLQKPRTAIAQEYLVKIIGNSGATKLELSSDGVSWKSCSLNFELLHVGFPKRCILPHPSGILCSCPEGWSYCIDRSFEEVVPSAFTFNKDWSATSFCVAFNKVYAFGLDSAASTKVISWSLNLSDNSKTPNWKTEPQMPFVDKRPIPIHIDDRIFVMASNAIFEFHLVERSWKKRCDVPACLRSTKIENAVALDGKLFIFHGEHMSIYTPASNAWKLLKKTPLTGTEGNSLLQVMVRNGKLTAIVRTTVNEWDSSTRKKRDFACNEMHVYDPTQTYGKCKEKYPGSLRIRQIPCISS